MEQNVLVTKMIGIVVAVIVAAVVLVPICNSLTEGDGDSGGGDGDGEISYIGNDLRNMAEKYGVEGFPFEAYNEYGDEPFNKSVTDLNLEITLNDVTTWLEQIRLSEESELVSLNLSILNMGITNYSTPVSVTYQYNLSDGVGTISVQLSSTTSMTIRTNGDSYNVEDFTISVVNGNATITWADGDETYSGSVGYASCFEKSSTQTHITYSFGTTASDDSKPYEEFEIYSGCNLTFVLIVGEDGEDAIDHSIVNYEVSEYVYDGTYLTISGSAVGDVGEYTFSIKFPVTPTGISDVYFTSDISADVSVQNASNESVPNSSIYLPVVSINAIESDTSGGSDSGSSGDGDLGVAGTIIGIIPVFVILAILMGAAGLFYQNRKTI